MAPMAPPTSFIPMQVAGVSVSGRKVPGKIPLRETFEGNNAEVSKIGNYRRGELL